MIEISIVFLALYAFTVIVIGIVACANEDAYNDLIRFKEIESVLDIILFMVSGPSLVFANILFFLYKALSCKFRERK